MATVALVKGQRMSEQEIMAEEMQSPKKVAFANRKYTNEERLKKEEKELEEKGISKNDLGRENFLKKVWEGLL